MSNPQRLILPKVTTNAPLRQTRPHMEATVRYPSQMDAHVLQPSLTSPTKHSNQLIILSNPPPFSAPRFQSHDGQFVPHPNSSLTLFPMNVLPMQYTTSNSPLKRLHAPVEGTVSDIPVGSRPLQIVTSVAGLPLLHATSGCVASGPIVKFCSPSTIGSQSLICSTVPTPNKYQMTAQNCNLDGTSNRFNKSQNFSPSKMFSQIDEKSSSKDEPSGQYATDEPLDLSQKTVDTGDRKSCVRNEPRTRLIEPSLRRTRRVNSNDIPKCEYVNRQKLKAIAICVLKIIAATKMAKDKKPDSSSIPHQRGNSINSNKTCSIREDVKPPLGKAEKQDVLAGDVDEEDLKETDGSARYESHETVDSFSDKTQFSRQDQSKRSDKTISGRVKADQLPSVFESSQKHPIERSKFDTVKLADTNCNAKQGSLKCHKTLARDSDIHERTVRTVNGSKSQVTFDQTEEVKVVGSSEGKTPPRKSSGGSVNTFSHSHTTSQEEDEVKGERRMGDLVNVGTKVIEKRCSRHYKMSENFRRRIKETKSLKSETIPLHKNITGEKAIKMNRNDTRPNISVRDITIPLHDVSKLLKSRRNSSDERMGGKNPVVTSDGATWHSVESNDAVKSFNERVVLKKDNKNEWAVIPRSQSRKRNATTMLGSTPSNQMSKRRTENLKDDGGNKSHNDDRFFFDKGDNKFVNQVHLSKKSSVNKDYGSPNSSASETEMLVTINSNSPQSLTPEEKPANRDSGTTSEDLEENPMPSNYLHMSAKEKVRFLRTRMKTSEEQVAKLLRK